MQRGGLALGIFSALAQILKAQDCADDDDRMRTATAGQGPTGAGFTCAEIAQYDACDQVVEHGWCECSCPATCADDDDRMRAATAGQGPTGAGFTCAEIAQYGACDQVVEHGWCCISCPSGPAPPPPLTCLNGVDDDDTMNNVYSSTCPEIAALDLCDALHESRRSHLCPCSCPAPPDTSCPMDDPEGVGSALFSSGAALSCELLIQELGSTGFGCSSNLGDLLADILPWLDGMFLYHMCPCSCDVPEGAIPCHSEAVACFANDECAGIANALIDAGETPLEATANTMERWQTRSNACDANALCDAFVQCSLGAAAEPTLHPSSPGGSCDDFAADNFGTVETECEYTCATLKTLFEMEDASCYIAESANWPPPMLPRLASRYPTSTLSDISIAHYLRLTSPDPARRVVGEAGLNYPAVFSVRNEIHVIDGSMIIQGRQGATGLLDLGARVVVHPGAQLVVRSVAISHQAAPLMEGGEFTGAILLPASMFLEGGFAAHWSDSIWSAGGAVLNAGGSITMERSVLSYDAATVSG